MLFLPQARGWCWTFGFLNQIALELQPLFTNFYTHEDTSCEDDDLFMSYRRVWVLDLGDLPPFVLRAHIFLG